MLPPVQLLRDLKASPGTDLSTGTDLPAATGSFGTAFAALFRPQAALPNPLAPGQSLSESGQTLPQGGKDLPVPGLTPAVAEVVPGLAGTPVDLDDLAALSPRPEHVRTQLAQPSDNLAPAELALPMPAGVDGTTSGEGVFSATTVTPAIAAEHAPLAGMVPATVLPALHEIVPQPVRPAGIVSPLPGTALLTDSVAAAAGPVTGRTDAAETHLAQPVAAQRAPTVLWREALTYTPANGHLPAPLQIASLTAEVSERKAAPAGSPSQAPVFAVTPAPVATTGASSGGMPVPGVADISLPPGSAGWGDALGDRVVWMAGNKVHNAEIRLSPADLGPLRVQISVDDGTANINFHAHHPVTRDAIEQALPRLRDMLGDQGLSLGNANVSGHDVKHDQSQSGRHSPLSIAQGDDEPVQETWHGAPRNKSSKLSLVDLFA